MARAVLLFERKTLPRWANWLPPLLTGLLLWVYVDQQKMRFVITGAIFLAQSGALAWFVYRTYRENGGAGRALVAFSLASMAAALLLRTIIYAFNLAPAQSFTAPSLIQTLTYLLVIVLLVLASLGFLFMAKERSDRALIVSEQHFRAFFERAMVGMATVTPEHRWIEVNQALCQMLGYSREELMRTSWVELTAADELAASMALFGRVLAGEIDDYEIDKRYRHKNGTYIDAHLAVRGLRKRDGSVDYFVVLIEDISLRKSSEAELAQRLAEMTALNRKLESAQTQLLQSEKLASIGQLAAGVAHEINNPIGFVKSNLGTLQDYTTSLFRLAEAGVAHAGDQHKGELAELDFLREDLQALLAESRDGVERVSKIVQDLKDFSRVGDTQWQWVDIHQGLDSTLNIAWNEFKYKCHVTKQYGALPEIYCLPSQLNQVFMNLLVNAAQAIEASGEVTICTECAGAEAVRISIRDNGAGISPEHLHRIFDPFFTTKPVGKGTGLGLSLAWGIIARHRGKIEVESEPGIGTRFTITLPIESAVQSAD